MIAAGTQFGRLTVLAEAGRHRNGAVLYRCVCICGREKIAQGGNLTGGGNRSCGCLRGEDHRERYGGPQGKPTAEYTAWARMISRCEYVKHNRFQHYGGRGIKVCPRWRESFAAFLEDMGRKPSPQHSMDRIDVNGNYEPENCRWATRSEQARNKQHHARSAV